MKAQRSTAACELCSLASRALGSSHSHYRQLISGSGTRIPEVTASGIPSLLLGVSVTLMLCGSLTFIIGFFLMPWVLGMFAVLYTVGFLRTLSGFARLVFAPITTRTPKSADNRFLHKYYILGLPSRRAT